MRPASLIHQQRPASAARAAAVVGTARATPAALAPARPVRPPRRTVAVFMPPTTRSRRTTPGTVATPSALSSSSSSSASSPTSSSLPAVGGEGEAPSSPLSMPNDPPGLPPFASPAAAAAAAAWAAEAGPPGSEDDTKASGFLTAAKGRTRTVPAYNKYRARTSIRKENYSSWVALMASEVRGAWRIAAAAAAGRGGSAAVARAAGLNPEDVTEAGPTFRIPRSAIENARPSARAMASFWSAWAWNVATPEPVRYAWLRVWRVLGPRVWGVRVRLAGAGARLDAWCAARGGVSTPPPAALAHALRRWHGKVGFVEDVRYRWGLLRGEGGVAA